MLSDLKDPKEVETFLSDFFEERELEKYIKRMMVAYWIKKGRDKENIKRNLQATPEEIVLRLVSQKRRVLSLLKKGERLTPPWARFAERHGDDLARLAQII